MSIDRDEHHLNKIFEKWLFDDNISSYVAKSYFFVIILFHFIIIIQIVLYVALFYIFFIR